MLTVTSFAVAHSITLALAALVIASAPMLLVEALVALRSCSWRPRSFAPPEDTSIFQAAIPG